jgi:hypothetical protein
MEKMKLLGREREREEELRIDFPQLFPSPS